MATHAGESNGRSRTEAVAPWSPQRIAIIGSGPMGISLAALVGSHVPTTIVCRDAARAEVLVRDGAEVVGLLEGSSRPRVVRAISGLRGCGGFSAIFIATKTTAIDEVASELAPLMPLLGDQGVPPFVISFQNGIETGRQLIARLRDESVLRMVLAYGARMRPDGRVGVGLCQHPQAIGCLYPRHRPVCAAIAAMLTASGLRTEVVDDIERRVWMKGVVNAAMNPVAALINASVGQVMDSPAALTVERLLDEGLAVARAHGVDLGPDARARAMAMLEAARPHTPSMVEDIREGRPSEVGQLNRQIVVFARDGGVSAPTHEAITSLIDAFDWRVFHTRGHAHHAPTPEGPGVPASTR